jgi:ASC-1-like (ASCH) protein
MLVNGMNYEMKLNPDPFERVASGKKIIEVRLYDEKRQRIQLGDTIEFSLLPDSDRKIRVEVVGLLRYKSFSQMVNDLPIGHFGYPDDYDKAELIKSIREIYDSEREARYGVLGIRMKLIQ